MQNKLSENGFGLLEIIISAALISGSLFALASVARLTLRATGESFLGAKASFLSEEALESARFVRDNGWTANITPLADGVYYYPVFSAGEWVMATTSPGLVDGTFDRRVIFEDVYRRTSDDNIVPSDSPDSKYLDSNTVKVRALVSWPVVGGATSSVELITFLTNLFGD